MLYAAISISVLVIVFALIYSIKKYYNQDAVAQRRLNRYLKQQLSSKEIGRFYERYIGHLYETEGYDVYYNGALNGYNDLGRDLIVECVDEVMIIQTKCWAKSKLIQEKHIFQLYGSMAHYKLTREKNGRPTRPVIFTTAKFSDTAKNAARVLRVELRTEELNRIYPMIKCSITNDGDKFYYLPFDPEYDKIKINLHKEEYFASSVKEAVEKGFRRASCLRQ